MISDLLALLFHSRDFGHRAHLRTKSYAAHMALGSFYEELTELTDSLTEMYQGRNGIVDIPYVTEPTAPDTDPVKALEEHLKVIEGVRYQAVPEKETAMQNTIDEIVAVFLQTLYKLKELS